MTRTAVLHPDLRKGAERRAPENALAEAVSLANALAGLEVVEGKVVPVPKPRAGFLFGSGKTEELAQWIAAEEIELVVIDGPVTPVQQRNLEKAFKCKLLDRTGLILEIFADRAQTREGVLQVDLAALGYQRTRLVRSWTHLERQRGGLGFVGGPGETQIEADRRALDERINQIRRALEKVVKTRGLHRKARAKVPYPIVALVGYTNAGKSTLFNTLSGADVMAKDMLFATLDPTMRSIELPSGQQIILSDTVGFISDLPPQLVAAFRATLEEVLDADLILHVRDISHPESEAQAQDVRDILESLGVSQAQRDDMIELWNKVDLLDDEAVSAAERVAGRHARHLVISATTGRNLDKLCELIDETVRDPILHETLNLPISAGEATAWLYARKLVISSDIKDLRNHLSVEWTHKQKEQFFKLHRAALERTG
ncbi:GTPase HflX [Pontivivens nitratireducens]|uniref:GTPase HflX n=1 Tax=Pontivivens nitratireducens TaxID=2758038 RepID=UPI00163B370C|nr:GTPase HflX [Pontibrevibacter nitratireducens]